MVACDWISDLARLLARHWMRGRGRFALRRNQPFQPDSLGNTLKTFRMNPFPLMSAGPEPSTPGAS